MFVIILHLIESITYLLYFIQNSKKWYLSDIHEEFAQHIDR